MSSVESLASWAFGFFGIEGIENDGFHQLPVDGFTTWTGCGFPIAILLFSLSYVKTSSDAGGGAFGKSQGLQCAPAYGGAGLKYSNNEDILIEKIAGDGFTQAFYMTNYCWDNMIDFPAKSQRINGTYIQVFDENQKDKVTNLSIIKYFPYAIILHSILVLWPYLVWRRTFGDAVKEQLDFLINGMEEGLTTMIGGLVMFRDWKEYRTANAVESHSQIIKRGLEDIMKKDPHYIEKFSVFRKYLISQAKSSEIMAAYQARRAFFAIHLLISTGLFYIVYFQDERHEFNCELEWDSNLLIRPLVLCNMQGVQIRRLMVSIICVVNLILVFVVIYCFIQRSV